MRDSPNPNPRPGYRKRVALAEDHSNPTLPALDQVPDAVIIASPDNIIRYANRAVTTLLGWEVSALLGQPVTVVVPPRLRSAHQAGFARFARTGTMRLGGRPLRVSALRADGGVTEIDLVLGPLPGSSIEPPRDATWALAVLRDVGDRLELERQLDVARYLRASIDVSSALHKTAATDEAFATLLPVLCENLDWEFAAIWQPDPALGRLVCVASWHDGTLPAAAEAMTRGITLRIGEGLPGHVWSTQHPTAATAGTPLRDVPRSSIATAHGLATGLGLPLLGTAGPLGVIELWSRSARKVDQDLEAVLLSIGRQLGMFLERLGAEAELRRTLDVLQTSLLPAALPSVAHLTLAAHYQAASGRVAVSGDFYDVFPLSGGWWAAVMADVCGKGAGAAAVTAMARYTVRAAALDRDDPRDVLLALNQALLADNTDRPFLTACLVYLNPRPDGATAVVTNAGHPLPLWRSHDGLVRPVGQPGDLLGVMASPEFVPSRVDLGVGDSLLLYTDGFTEARSPDGEELGEAGLAQMLAAVPAHHPAEMIEALVAGLARHTGSRETTDDAAALAITAGS